MPSLSRIRLLADTIAQAEHDLAIAVSAARSCDGASWSAIGSALRISRQAAQQRFGSR